MKTHLTRVVQVAFFAGLAILPGLGAYASVAPGDILVTNNPGSQGNFVGSIVDINPQSGAQSIVSSGGLLISPTAMCLNSSGDIIVAGWAPGWENFPGQYPPSAIVRIDPQTGSQTLIASGGLLTGVFSIAATPDGNYVVAQNGSNGISGEVLSLNSTTGVPTPFASGSPMDVVTGIAVEPDGNYLVSNYQSLSGILRIDAQSAAQSIVTSGGNFRFGPQGICLNDVQSQSLLVSEVVFDDPAQTGLINVNTLTGEQTVVSVGGQFYEPVGVTQNSLGYVYIADEGPYNGGPPDPQVLGIDLQTGDQEVVSSGGLLDGPAGIVVYVPEPGSCMAIAALGARFLSRRDKRRIITV